MPQFDRDDVISLAVSLALGLLLIGAYLLGRRVRARLPPEHRSREMTELLLAVIAMLVTFSAIALGLMLNSSMERLQRLNDLVSGLANHIVRLDDSLVEYGSAAQLAHVAIVNYARREAAGLTDDESTRMTDAALKQVELLILRFDLSDNYRQSLKRDALARYADIADTRFRLLAEGAGSSNLPFNITLAIWLLLTYFVFGLNSEKNFFILIALSLSALAVVAATFVILDMETALGGLISVSREPLELALRQMR